MTLKIAAGTNVPSHQSDLAALPSPLAAAIDCTEISPSFVQRDIRWVVTNRYARGRRPGYRGHKQVHREKVDGWISEAKHLGIRSVICVLADDLLKLYSDLPVDLVSYFRQSGLKVEHIPLLDSQWPNMNTKDFKRVLNAYKLPRPLLLLCNKGRDKGEKFWEQVERALALPSSLRPPPQHACKTALSEPVVGGAPGCTEISRSVAPETLVTPSPQAKQDAASLENLTKPEEPGEFD
jgi:protein tyrosine phosphatase (PTP) superfamily phosphohydrolase (DUF442 family)